MTLLKASLLIRWKSQHQFLLGRIYLSSCSMYSTFL